MGNWYKSPLVKGIMIVTSCISAVAAMCMFLLAEGSNYFYSDNLFSAAGRSFEDSQAFQDMMAEGSWSIFEGISCKKDFETEGKYDPEKVVDILEFSTKETISGENISGLAYRLGELSEWSSSYINGKDSIYAGNIVVCQKQDATYHYYYKEEFLELVRAGKIISDVGMEQFLEELEEGFYNDGRSQFSLEVTDEQTVYKDCWTIDQQVEELYSPIGAENLLEIVNNNEELNGKLTQVYEHLRTTLAAIGDRLSLYKNIEKTWSEGNTNLTYLLADMQTKQIYTNNSSLEKYSMLNNSLKILSGDGKKFIFVKPKLADFESNLDANASYWKNLVDSYMEDNKEYVFVASVDCSYPVQDMFYKNADNYQEVRPYLSLLGVKLFLAVILFLFSMVWLTVTAGRTPNDTHLHLNAFDRWKTGLGAAAVIIPWLIISWFFGKSNISLLQYEYYGMGIPSIFSVNFRDMIFFCLYIIVTMLLFLAGYLSLVRRIKGGTVWKNSVTAFLVHFVREFWINRSVTLRTAALYAGFLVIHWFVLLAIWEDWFEWSGVLLSFVIDTVFGYFLIKNAVMKEKIRKGIEAISAGNVNYQIPNEGMRGESLVLAEKINNIGSGLQKAVEEGLRSERLKTDLITNVSHDIKTPLTSIINYVDLLKRENFEDPKIQGYLNILEAKAQRLKTLTEDVVEASKVSSGNITLEYMDVNLVEMLNQTIGEFSEKFAARSLSIVAKLPEEPAIIYVDNRRMWRVLENIFNNAAKYAMPGTRVYADLDVKGKQVIFSLKNISEQPLNISADELTERFIRGDVARSTEGSGLGLSIARSLTEMQGGQFGLYLDGDLFKVTVSFFKK